MIKDFISGFTSGMKEFGLGPTRIINTILLSVAYIIGVGLTAIVARITGKKFLGENKKGAKTYWETLNLGKKPIDEYYRQF